MAAPALSHMRAAKTLAALVLMSALCTAHSRTPSTGETVFAKANGSVVKIAAVSPSGERQGSAVVYKSHRGTTVAGQTFRSQSYLVTNAHVVKGVAQVEIRLAGLSKAAKVKYSDSALDLALLIADDVSLPSIPLREGLPRIGEEVYALGSPKGFENSLSAGIVSGIRNINGTAFIQATAAISPGSSGGALLDADGRLLGVTTARVVDGEGLNFSISAQDISRITEASDASDLLAIWAAATERLSPGERTAIDDRVRLTQWLYRSRLDSGHTLAAEVLKHHEAWLSTSAQGNLQATANAFRAFETSALAIVGKYISAGSEIPAIGTKPSAPSTRPLRLQCDVRIAVPGGEARTWEIIVDLVHSTVNGMPAHITEEAISWITPGLLSARIGRYSGAIVVTQARDDGRLRAGQIILSGKCLEALERRF